MAAPVRFVVIDDHPPVAFYLKTLLPRKGAVFVGSAATGGEGLALIQEQKPDLVMVDWMLPDMNGFQVQRQATVKARWVLLSGFAEPGIVQKALDLGFIGVISKTTSIADQLQVLARVVAGATIALDSRSQLCLRILPDSMELQTAAMIRSAVKGEPTKVVAERLGTTTRAVQRTLKEVKRHYRLESPEDLLIFARRHRLIDDEKERALLM